MKAGINAACIKNACKEKDVDERMSREVHVRASIIQALYEIFCFM